MLKEELLKNISLISKYFKSEKLSDEGKLTRKKLSLLITNNIKDILYELYFEGFLLGTVETWGYKKNKLTINFKKTNYEIFFSIQINIETNTLQISLRAENKYIYFEDVSLKITKKAIDNSSIHISNFDWDNITFTSKELNIDSDDFENDFLKETKIMIETVEEKEFQYKDFYNNVDKNDLFIFDANCKAQISWKDLNNYTATSKKIKSTTQNLLEYLSQVETSTEKKEIKLVIAHLNLSIGYKFFNVIRMSDSNEKEKILMFEEMIKRVLATIDNHIIDGKASLSTRLYSNMFAGVTRGKHIVVSKRILEISPIGVGIHIIRDLDLRQKKLTGQYPTISKLVELGLEVAKEKQIENDKRQLKKQLRKQNLSSVSRLANDLGVSLEFEESVIKHFVKKVKLIANNLLDEREFEFFSTRYSLDSILQDNSVRQISLQKIADKHKLTRERVRQLEKISLKKIKAIYEEFPYNEIPKSYLTLIPETFKNKGKKKILTKIGKTFIKNDLYVVGQLKSKGILDASYEDLVNHPIFKGLDKLIILKYFSTHFPEVLDKKSISYLYGSNQISVRSYNALIREGIYSTDEIQVDELENIPNLGKKSIFEIKNLIKKGF